jgi:alanine racemase
LTTPLRVRLSASALAANAAEAVRRAGAHAVADLRRDAWGHGLAPVAAALVAAGVRAARVDDAARATVTAAGLTATDAAPTLDTALLLGLPGGGGLPVMRAAGAVLSTKTLLAGEGVSYGYTHRAASDTRIALVTGGYAQGIVRGLGNHIDVEIAGRLHRVVGRVAMDVCVVDIGDADVSPGDEVVFFGGDGPAQDALAMWERESGLSAAEIAAAVGLRAVREGAS